MSLALWDMDIVLPVTFATFSKIFKGRLCFLKHYVVMGWLWPEEPPICPPAWHLNYLGSLRCLLQNSSPEPEFLGLRPGSINVDSVAWGQTLAVLFHYLRDLE